MTENVPVIENTEEKEGIEEKELPNNEEHEETEVVNDRPPVLPLRVRNGDRGITDR